MKFEYVASGLNYTYLPRPAVYTDINLVAMVREIIKYSQNISPHQISVLFNAFSEKRFPECFNILFKDLMTNIFSDSGGLQVLTMGKQFDLEMKKKVYQLQATESTIAMSFDEIPVSTLTSKASITNHVGKTFNSHLFVDYAKKTRDNLIEQCEFFLKLNSKTKILPIMQGNCIETYGEWYHILMDNLSPEHKSVIGGMSVAMAAFGLGMKEEIERIMVIEKFIKEYDYIHLLGVGSLSRFFPLLILLNNGFLSSIKKISYDSTTHTSNLSRGEYFYNSKFPRLMTKRFIPNLEVTKIVEDIHLKFGPLLQTFKEQFGLDVGEEEIYHAICKSYSFSSCTFTKYPKHEYLVIVIFLFFMSQIINFANQLDIFLTDKDQLKQFIHKTHPNLLTLFNVHSLDDYYSWNKSIGHMIQSKAIKSHKEMSHKNTNSLF